MKDSSEPANLTARRVARSASPSWLRPGDTRLPQAGDEAWAVVEFVPDAVVVVDQAGVIAYVNAQTEVMFGYGRDELIGHPVEILLPERFRPLHQHHRVGYIDNPRVRQMGAYLDVSARHKHGREFPVEIALSPLPAPGAMAYIATVRSISGRVHMHEELRRANEAVKASLERTRVAYHREHLVAKRLRELDETKNDFIGIVAHDLRSPMATIGGFAATMLSEWDRLDEERRRRILEIIVRNVEEMNELVGDILDVTQIESAHMRLEIGPFDLAELIGRVTTEMASSAGRICNVDIPQGLPRALGDAIRQRQILTNLVSNAFKFSDPSSPVEVRVLMGPVMIEVSVRDHGIGIRPQDLDIIFEKFSRIRVGDGVRQSGTGLGLYICRALVEAQGGTIVAESRAGEGSTFTYTVPVA